MAENKMIATSEKKLQSIMKDLELHYSSVAFTEALAERYQQEKILPSYHQDQEVMRGLRYPNGTGVMAGVTGIGDVIGYHVEDGKKMPADGRLYYRGYNIQDIVDECVARDQYGFEEVVYLLLFGELPSDEQLKGFRELMARWGKLPTNFTEDIILRFPEQNIMSKLQSCIIALHAYDGYAEDFSLASELYKSFRMVARIPTIVSHSYAAKQYYFNRGSLILHEPRPDYSIAQNFLHTLRPNQEFTEEEAKLLDLCLILHAEHGGGNNSTFTCRVLSSAGSDFYSSIAAATGSLKGFRHGGANIAVSEMMKVIKEEVKDWSDEGQIRDCLARIIRREIGDGKGLIYGMGHAIYTRSDPRAVILKKFSRSLAEKKGMEKELHLMELIEKNAPEVFLNEKGSDKPICANVDFYSGFIYRMLGIPEDVFTPLFATARMPGWCAHRIEECCSPDTRIIRPAYKNVMDVHEFLPIDQRHGKVQKLESVEEAIQERREFLNLLS